MGRWREEDTGAWLSCQEWAGHSARRTQPDSQALTCRGCRSASSSEMREVSRTRDGFPSRASMYRPATSVAFLAE